MIGRIKNVRPIEGYGFLACEDGVDRFFHRTACVGMTLADTLLGKYAEFDPALGSKGPCAVHVMLITSTPAAGIPIGAGFGPRPEIATGAPTADQPRTGDAVSPGG